MNGEYDPNKIVSQAELEKLKESPEFIPLLIGRAPLCLCYYCETLQVYREGGLCKVCVGPLEDGWRLVGMHRHNWLWMPFAEYMEGGHGQTTTS